MKKKSLLIAIPLVAAAVLVGNYFTKQPVEVNILHINDHHSHLEPSELDFVIDNKKTKVKIGGYPELVSVIKEFRESHKDNTLVLHAGDAITGTLYFSLFRGSADAELMNETGIDYFTLGNHEFDAGNEGLKKFLDYLKIPVLSANVIPQKGSILEGYWEPYAIKEINGEKIGIIGLDVVGKTKESSNPGKDIDFTDEVETTQKYADILKEQGVNKIILLSHAGANGNFNIAQKVTGVDVIITGDTHYLFGNDEIKKMELPVVADYPTKFMSPANEPVYVVEAWEYSKLVGNLNVKFDRNGIVEEVVGNPVIPYHLDSSFTRRDENGEKYTPEGEEREAILAELNATKTFQVAKADEKATEILNKFKQEKEILGNQFAGEIVGSVMPGGSANRIPSAENPQGSIATRFIAESMLTSMRSYGAHIDLTIQNSGGVRSDIEPGKMTYNDVYTMLPFGNTLFLLEMSGEEIKQVLEDAINFAMNKSTGAFPYTAGLRYEANQYPNEQGKRLVKVEVQNETTGEFEPIDDSKLYKVGTNSYIAGGQDGYYTFAKVVEKRGGEDTYLPDAENFIKFLEIKKSVESYKDSNAIFHFDAENPVTKK
ncbi:NAD nucleotidase [Otariodibacter oris]|uniref:5'-nucleotidase n=1 Tax=Otariodibacter oris TaxID=1032623 RepID=A0A420XG48_9PAST|nr:NAD nucleotidase [Otariodibacter oris]QGM79947.1 NAD nucleotidase [Otariodibacter oris]RKR71768.1 5'-nucleotidase [Otariodibacter oris]